MQELSGDSASVGTSYFHGERGRRLLRGLKQVIVSDYGEDPGSPREDEVVLPGTGLTSPAGSVG